MPIRVKVHLLPKRAQLGELTDQQVIVIDVLRATTTIVQALASGATEVLPFPSVDEAIAASKSLDPSPLLCGERYGFKVDGFDLGNSPSEYVPEVVGGKRLALSTTNGTKALAYSRGAAAIYVAAFTNLSAICRAVADQPTLHIVCAGTNGEVTREDALLAGALIAHIDGAAGEGAGADIAEKAWVRIEPANLAEELKSTLGGINLIKVGMGDDLPRAAQIDQFDLVPIFDPETGVIRCE